MAGRSSDPLKTTVAWVPDWAGKRCSSRSWAFWDSMPGTVKSSLKLPPTLVAPAISATSARRTTAVVTRGRRPLREAMRERREDMSGKITRLSRNFN